MKKSVLVLNFIIIYLFSCQQHHDPIIKNKVVEPKIKQQPKPISYRIENAKQWLLNHKDESLQQKIVFAVNRTDSSNFSQMDSIVIPDDLTRDIVNYLPFPLNVPYLRDINKIIFFSYPAQTFATYEKGILQYTGPTNMGSKKNLTPTGLFNTNWKAKVTISTINDEWILHWNFNILSMEGVGWHQYSLPGYPASHSCLRLQENDAHYLYTWADQWILSKKDSFLIKGTPIIIFGSYDFKVAKPWLKLITNPHAFDITIEELQKETTPYLKSILAEQKKRVAFQDDLQYKLVKKYEELCVSPECNFQRMKMLGICESVQ